MMSDQEHGTSEQIYDVDSSYFGDLTRPKTEDVFRFAGQNAGGLPVTTLEKQEVC